MISFQNVSKSFGGQTVLADVSFRVNEGERVGVVGPNGAGKSTVFGLVVGETSADAGEVLVPANCRLGYVRQELDPHGVSGSLLDYVRHAIPAVQAIQAEMASIEEKLREEGAGGDAALLGRLGDLQSEFEHLGGYDLKYRAEQTLSGLGFSVEAFEAPFASFSGGWRSRAELARVLVGEPQLLLLDEPSNYLDIPAVEWLQKFLREFRGTLMMISHDRYLLNSLATVTLEMANARMERYPGNYDFYAQERTLRVAQRLAAQKNQQRKREQVQRFVDRFRATSTKAAQVQSRIKMLEKMESVDVPQRIVSPGSIRLRPPPHSGAEVVRLEQAGLSYDGERWTLRGIDLSIMRGDKVALVGLNGLGKTTLLRMLAGRLDLSEGRRVLGHKVVIGYQSQDFVETMDPDRTVLDTVKSVAPDVSEQETRTLLGGFGFSGDAVQKKVIVLSGGEKIRVAFARLLVKPPNFLLLDEPTTHLDIQAREALQDALAGYGGTLCLVSHDIDFVRHVAGSIIAMTPPGIRSYAGDYDHYKHMLAMDGEAGGKAGDPGGARGTRAAAGAVADGKAGGSKKDQRRERALQRQEAHAQTKEIKKGIRRAEKQIDVYEAECGRLIERLSAETPGSDFVELNKRLRFVQTEIEQYTRRWDSLAAELEALESGAED